MISSAGSGIAGHFRRRGARAAPSADSPSAPSPNAEAAPPPAAHVGATTTRASGPTPSTNTLAWHDIGCHVPDASDRRREAALLQGIAGVAASGDFVAIVGPSGAGKTTLLDTLTRRKTIGRVEGAISFNGAPVAEARDMQPHAAYVMQEESFHATSTVMEAMLFQAHMRMPRAVPAAAKRARARRLLAAAGLQGKEGMRVGGQLPGGFPVRGLSGGERRRLSLCCGAVGDAGVLFCDEVTSGLDSIGALSIATMLHGFCAEGKIVLCTMHQPRLGIWRLVTTVLVLSKGRQLYFGPPAGAERWFAAGLGLTVPPDTTPVDFIVDQVNIDFGDKSRLYRAGCKGREQPPLKQLTTVEDIEQAATSFRRHHPDVYAAASAAVHPTKGVVSLASRPSGGALEAARDWWFKFGVLLRRDLQAYARNPANAIFRFAAYVGVAVLSGTYLYKIGEGRGLLGLNIVIADLFFSLLAQELFPYVSQSLFAHSRAFYSVENAAGLYPPSCYYCSLVLTELALNASCGFVSGAYSYYSNGFATFFNPARPWAACAGWSAFVMLLNSVTNAQLVFYTMLMPNQQLAYMASAGFSILSVMMSGGVVPLSAMAGRTKNLAYLSVDRYMLAGVLYHFFGDCRNNVTSLYGSPRGAMRMLQLDVFDGAWKNALACLGFYLFYTVGGFLCLKYLHRERR